MFVHARPAFQDAVEEILFHGGFTKVSYERLRERAKLIDRALRLSKHTHVFPPYRVARKHFRDKYAGVFQRIETTTTYVQVSVCLACTARVS